MRASVIPLALLFAGLAAGCAPIPVSRQAGVSSRDPAVAGRNELLSSAELHALLVVARAKLASFAPQSGIFEVEVVSSSKVKAYYGDRSSGFAHHLVLERIAGSWRVTETPSTPDRIYRFEDEDVVFT